MCVCVCCEYIIYVHTHNIWIYNICTEIWLRWPEWLECSHFDCVLHIPAAKEIKTIFINTYYIHNTLTEVCMYIKYLWQGPIRCGQRGRGVSSVAWRGPSGKSSGGPACGHRRRRRHTFLERIWWNRTAPQGLRRASPPLGSSAWRRRRTPEWVWPRCCYRPAARRVSRHQTWAHGSDLYVVF